MELTARIHIEEGAYWADVPELAGCFASGDTLEELFESLKDGIALYLADEPAFIITEERGANEFAITRETSWKSMLGKGERDATEEEIAALEAEHGPFLPADDEG